MSKRKEDIAMADALDAVSEVETVLQAIFMAADAIDGGMQRRAIRHLAGIALDRIGFSKENLLLYDEGRQPVEFVR